MPVGQDGYDTHTPQVLLQVFKCPAELLSNTRCVLLELFVFILSSPVLLDNYVLAWQATESGLIY
jgi:hypothetical protein